MAASSSYSFELSFEIDTDDEEDAFEGHPVAEQLWSLFGDVLLDLKVKGKISARDVCARAYYGSHVGLKGPAEAFGYNLVAQSGKFQRHLDNVLKLDVVGVGDSYILPVLAYDRLAISRTTEHVVCLLAHEALQAEIEENDSAKFKLRESVEGHERSEVSHLHLVVRVAPLGELVYPCAMYVDGIEFQNRETLTGFFVYNLIVGVRHFCLAIRKSSLCRCGCLGHCTIYISMRLLVWSFDAPAQGRRPCTRHDSSPFGIRDGRRKEQADRPFMRGTIVFIKGDWAEFAHTFGMSQWNSGLHPCPCCVTAKKTLYAIGSLSVVSSPFPDKTHDYYEVSCLLCEKVVLIG